MAGLHIVAGLHIIAGLRVIATIQVTHVGKKQVVLISGSESE